MQNDTTIPITIDISGNTNEPLRGPDDLQLEIDSNEARRLLTPSETGSVQCIPAAITYKVIRAEMQEEVLSSDTTTRVPNEERQEGIEQQRPKQPTAVHHRRRKSSENQASSHGATHLPTIREAPAEWEERRETRRR